MELNAWNIMAPIGAYACQDLKDLIVNMVSILHAHHNQDVHKGYQMLYDGKKSISGLH